MAAVAGAEMVEVGRRLAARTVILIRLIPTRIPIRVRTLGPIQVPTLTRTQARTPDLTLRPAAQARSLRIPRRQRLLTPAPSLPGSDAKPRPGFILMFLLARAHGAPSLSNRLRPTPPRRLMAKLGSSARPLRAYIRTLARAPLDGPM
jgi:hypothetical protein